MKRYMVSGAVILNFADGRRVTLEPGIHNHPDDVAEHWAFKHYAQALDADQPPAEEPPEVEQPPADTEAAGGTGKEKGNAKK